MRRAWRARSRRRSTTSSCGRRASSSSRTASCPRRRHLGGPAGHGRDHGGRPAPRRVVAHPRGVPDRGDVVQAPEGIPAELTDREDRRLLELADRAHPGRHRPGDAPVGVRDRGPCLRPAQARPAGGGPGAGGAARRRRHEPHPGAAQHGRGALRAEAVRQGAGGLRAGARGRPPEPGCQEGARLRGRGADAGARGARGAPGQGPGAAPRLQGAHVGRTSTPRRGSWSRG